MMKAKATSSQPNAIKVFFMEVKRTLSPTMFIKGHLILFKSTNTVISSRSIVVIFVAIVVVILVALVAGGQFQ